MVGRRVLLRFGTDDATVDLHEQGEISATVTAVTLEGSPPSEKIIARVTAPSPMVGLTVTLETRYEGEPLERALSGSAVAVTAFFTNASGKAVAGGLGTAAFAPR